MHPHLEALVTALRAEERWQRQEHARLLALDPPAQVEAGVRWPALTLRDVRPGRQGPTLVLSASGPLHDGIGAGERVRVVAGALEREGRCTEPGGRKVELTIDDRGDRRGQAWTPGSTVTVTRAFDPTTFTRLHTALRRADEAAGDGELVDVLLGDVLPEVHDAAPVDWPDLNPAQRAAAGVALAADPVALVHGPPGTGKTTLVGHLLRHLVDAGERPWALAASNAATDHLALAAAARDLRVVRLGSRWRIGRAAWHLSLDAQVMAGPYAEALRVLDRDIDRALSSRSPGVEVGSLFRERRALEHQARDHVIDGAEVIACTLGSLARLGPQLPPTGWAIVDEATQAIEPSVWTCAPYAARLVLVGDPHQLGPVVMEPGNPLSRSLLQRLLDEGALPLPMLTVQHRMHTDIQALVAHVYGDSYAPHPDVAGHLLCHLPGVAATPLTSAPVLFVDTAGAGCTEARDPVSRSLYSEGEVALVARAVAGLRAAGVPAAGIGVIAAYSAQVARLREVLAAELREGVEVSTVDGFQGREKEAILCSFVRSNERGEVGFLDDQRRLTVASSRARRLWLGFGDSGTLSRAGAFQPVLDQVEALGGWRTAWEDPWVDALGLL